MGAKVVHVTTVHPAIDNRILNKECRSLAEAGYDVVLLAPHEREEVIHGVRIRPLPRWDTRLARVTRGAFKALRAARVEAGDVYHLHDPELLWIAPFLPGPVIYDMHENVPLALSTKAWLPGPVRNLAGRAWSAAERWLLRNRPVVFAERSYARHYPDLDPSVVVENMVRAELTDINVPKNEEFTVVYVGGLTDGRGIDVTLTALEALWEAGEPVLFECVGPAYNEHTAERLKRGEERWGSRLRVHGRLPAHEAMDIVARAHVGLALLKPRPNYVESFPTKMFEYMALGLPVIASDFPLYREVIDGAGAGVCIDPENPEELQDKIRELRGAPDLVLEMARKGRAAVLDRYSWGTEQKKLVGFYEEILAGRGPAGRPG